MLYAWIYIQNKYFSGIFISLHRNWFEMISEKRDGHMGVKEGKQIEFPVDGGLIIIFQGIAKITYVRLCKNDNIECC